jgi:hypothetical protein
MFLDLIAKFWNDEAGSVIATEYLMLGSIVVMGSASGLASMRDTMNDEYKEYGNSVREVRQAYSVPVRKSGGGSTGGTTAIDRNTAVPAVPNSRTVQFIAPTP